VKFRTTERGFAIAEFTDLYGAECSLQKSSLATEDAIWFGVTEPEVSETGWHPDWPARARPVSAERLKALNFDVFGRMHLTQDMVRELLPALQHFAETGELPAPSTEGGEGG
jgi:hypothetical protein